MKNVFKTFFFYFVVFAMVLGNSVLSIDFSVPIAHATQDEGDKITICHATGSGYVTNQPNKTADAGGHAGVSHQDGEDIIPPFDYDEGSFPGQNWDTEGQAIYNNDCKVPEEEDDGQCILEVVKTDDGFDPVAPGDNITYQITVTNIGDGDCRDVWLKDFFDENTSYVESNPEYNVDAGGYLVWYLPTTMEPEDSEQVELTMQVSENVKCDSTIKNEVKVLYKEGDSDEGIFTEPVVQETSIICNEEEDEGYTLKASKIVCETEEDLPNWGNGSTGPSYIDESTAEDYVENSDGACWFVEDWAFQWGTDVADPGNDFTGEAGSDWNNFDSTTGDGTMAEAFVEGSDLEVIKVREVLPEGYIPFAWDQADGGDGTANDVSAEIYCYEDILNYDNYDFVRNPEEDNTYYCVAFNVALEPEEECSLEDSILVNGSFEEPEVTNVSLWQKFTSGLVNWIVEKVSDSSDTTLEVHRGWSGNEAAHGWQYAELDGDQSTRISQSTTTEAGATYKLFWSFAGRHSIDAAQNNLSVEVDGSQVATNGPTTGSAPLASGDWENSTYEFVAGGTSTEVAFKDLGPSDTYGTYVDNVRLCKIADPEPSCGNYTTDDGEDCDDGPNGSNVCTAECTLVYSPHCGDGEVNQDWEQCDGTEGCTEQCQEEEQNECSDLTLSRVNVSGVSNVGNGDMSSDIYLGSDSYVIPQGTWFPVYWNGAPYSLDADVAGYEDVPGFAIQRLANSVRTVMHTTLTKNDSEEVYASLEFYNANATGYSSDPSNTLENSGTYPDWVNVHDGMADFYLWANTGDDGFYTTWSIVEDCDDPEYSPYCGDGDKNQEWEECDPGEDVISAATIQVGCSEQCQYLDTPECSDLTLAKVNIDDVQNWGNGDMTSDLFLGSSSYMIPQGVWFALYWNGSYFTDPDVSTYEDVEGLAVQRLEGSVRTVMYGTGTGSDKEHVYGNVEFYNATVGTQVSDESNDYPGNNRLENGFDSTGVGSYNAGNDEVWVEDGKSFYWLTTTTADDGYYTTWDIIEDCNTAICGVKFNDLNEDLQQGEAEENLVDWTINLYEKYSCEEGDEWADSVVEFNQGQRKDGSDVLAERSNAGNSLGVAQNNNTINFVSLGFGGELVLEFDNLIENGSGDDIQVFETSYNNPSCANYPEYVHVYASQNGSDWEDLGVAECQAGDPTFDLGALPWAKYVKLVDESDINSPKFGNAEDGFDVDGVKALHCLNASEEPLETAVTDESGYCFEELDPGYYMVCEELQDGWINSTPLCQQVYVEEGDSVGVDFGNYTEITKPYCGDGQVNQEGEECDGDEPVECTTEEGYAGYQSCNMPSDDIAPLQSVVIDYCVWGGCETYEYCGDTIVNGNEQCDTEEGCTESCTWEQGPEAYCGDGDVNQESEQCDGEGTQSCTDDRGYEGIQTCNLPSEQLEDVQYCVWNECVSEYYCGDGLLNSPEQCDDGNTNSGDGCSSSCTTEGGGPTITTSGGGGGGPVGFSIRNLNSAVSCSGVELSWLTSQTSDTIVSYGTESGNYTVDINNDTNATGHSVVLNGLLPATTYYYQVTAINSSGKTIVVAEKSFTTPGAEQCGAVLGERIESPLVCNFLRASGSSGPDADVEGVFTFPNGTLLRDACDRLETVYLIKDQKKWHVPNWKYLHDNHFGQRIYNVLSSVIKAYPDWTAQVLGVKRYADGTLLRGSDMKIYIIEDGKKHHITTFAELLKYAGQEIINVSDEVLNQY